MGIYCWKESTKNDPNLIIKFLIHFYSKYFYSKSLFLKSRLYYNAFSDDITVLLCIALGINKLDGTCKLCVKSGVIVHFHD